MPRLEYFLVCESTVTDKHTNRVSLFNVIEDVQLQRDSILAAGFSFTQLEAVACWNREEGDEEREFQQTLRIEAPEMEAVEFRMNFEMDRPRQRLALKFGSTPRYIPGEIKFKLFLDGEPKASHTVNIFPPE